MKIVMKALKKLSKLGRKLVPLTKSTSPFSLNFTLFAKISTPRSVNVNKKRKSNTEKLAISFKLADTFSIIITKPLRFLASLNILKILTDLNPRIAPPYLKLFY
jgi:hypothetical protein